MATMETHQTLKAKEITHLKIFSQYKLISTKHS